MKLIMTLLLALPSFAIAGPSCLDRLDLVNERDQKVSYCSSGDLHTSETCHYQGKKCHLVKDLEQKPAPDKLKKAFAHSTTGTVGSRLCNLKGWTVLMATMFDGSQVCTCQHPSGESITTSSLEEYYREK